jgi:hypothetical protein
MCVTELTPESARGPLPQHEPAAHYRNDGGFVRVGHRASGQPYRRRQALPTRRAVRVCWARLGYHEAAGCDLSHVQKVGAVVRLIRPTRNLS